MLSQFARPSYAFELLAVGTDGIGYMLKDRVSDLAALADGVRRVAAGESMLDPSVVAQLVGRPRRGRDPLEELTEREQEVLGLMAEGRSNRGIAEELVSPSTRSRSTSRTSCPSCRSRRAPTTTGGCSRC